MGDWSNLPRDIIQLIFGRLEFLSDIQRFAFVCLLLRSIAMESCHPFHPMLILSYDEDAEKCNLYDPVDKKVFKLHLPELHKKWCCGCSYGWLMTVDDDLMVHLLDPFSRAQVSLPPLTPLSPFSTRWRDDLIEDRPTNNSWKSIFIEKLVISTSPLNPDCLFIKLGGRYDKVSYCRATDETWTVLDVHCGQFTDAIYYEGRIFVACRSTCAYVWDLRSNKNEGPLVPVPHRESPECELPQYFVESYGELFIVVRHLAFRSRGDVEESKHKGELKHIPTTIDFEVFKLIHKEDPCEEEEPWERVTCLGDRALFVGRQQSLSVSVTQFLGYEANHVYFTDDFEGGFYVGDTGAFNLEDGSVTYYALDDHIMHWPPTWFKQH